MQDVTLVLLSAGSSTRFGLPVKKQWLYIQNKPLWQFVAEQFSEFEFNEVIVVGNKQELKLMKDFALYRFIEGGKETRAQSVFNAIKEVKSDYVLISDIARCCIEKDIVKKLYEKREKASCVVPALKVSDTTYFDGKPIDREKLLQVQTPQLSCTKTLKEILSKNQNYTDESSAFYANGKKVIFIDGSKRMHKLTYKEDLKLIDCLKAPIDNFKVGIGVDIHPFIEGKEMVLGGVKIDSNVGFKAHSDGDVAIHAIIDALLGAANLGDIGELFPDNDDRYKNIDSKELLKESAKLVKSVGYEIVNIDLTILAQKPKISPYKDEMKKVLSQILNIDKSQINIKATTGEKLGFVGREEGVEVRAIATLNYFKWERAWRL